MDKIEKIKKFVNEEADRWQDTYCDSMRNNILSFLDPLSEEPDIPELPETFEICLYDGRTPNKENCNECSTTYSVRKEEPDKSLEEAAEKWCKENGRGFVLRDKSAYYIGETLPAFKAGAKWQEEQDLAEMAQSRSPLSVAYANRCFENGKQAMKEQMLKDAVEGEARVGYPFSKPFIDIEQSSAQWCNMMKKFMNGDKVRIVVLKAEEE